MNELLVDDGAVDVEAGSHAWGAAGMSFLGAFDELDANSRCLGNEEKTVLDADDGAPRPRDVLPPKRRFSWYASIRPPCRRPVGHPEPRFD